MYNSKLDIVFDQAITDEVARTRSGSSMSTMKRTEESVMSISPTTVKLSNIGQTLGYVLQLLGQTKRDMGDFINK